MKRRRRAPGVLLPILLAAGGCGDTTQPGWVEGVAVTPESTGMGIGESVTLEATALDRNGEPLPGRQGRITFRSANPAVVSVEDLGDGRALVTALDLGTTRVEATLGRGTGSSQIFVQPPGLAQVRVEPSSLQLGLFANGNCPCGSSVRAILLDVNGQEIDPTGFFFDWEMGNSEVARIVVGDGSRQITVTSVGEGTTTLTVRVGSRTASATITVQ